MGGGKCGGGDVRGADLCGADLCGAELCWTGAHLGVGAPYGWTVVPGAITVGCIRVTGAQLMALLAGELSADELHPGGAKVWAEVGPLVTSAIELSRRQVPERWAEGEADDA